MTLKKKVKRKSKNLYLFWKSKKPTHYVPTTTYMMKHRHICFMSVVLPIIYANS